MDLIVAEIRKPSVDSAVENIPRNYFTSSSSGYHKVICLNSECKPWIIHVISLLVMLSTYAMEDGQTATSVPHHHRSYGLKMNPHPSKSFLNVLYQSRDETSIPYRALSTATYSTFLPFSYTTYGP